MRALALSLAFAWCVLANATPPETVAPSVPSVPAKPPHDETWQEVARRIGVDEAQLRACKKTSECTALPHFTRCCSFVAIAKAHVATVKNNKGKLDGMQTQEQALQCATGECRSATSPVACAQGWCVLDPQRDVWTKVAPRTGLSPEALRACTVDDECTLTRNPARCCDTVALAKSALEKVTALGDKLMTKQEREGCAIKKCGVDPMWKAVCREGLCQADIAP